METNIGVEMVVSARAAASLFLGSGQGLKICDREHVFDVYCKFCDGNEIPFSTLCLENSKDDL
jgi:hypothetical protein